MNVLQALMMAILTGVLFVVAGLGINFWAPLLLGFISGVVVGDVTLGLVVGGTCALMALGFYTYGGATIPDYNVGAIFAVFVGNQAGIEQGIVIGSVIALFMSIFDILGRMSNTFCQHRGDAALKKKDLKSFGRWFWAGTLPWGLSRAIPVFIGMLFIDQYTVIQNLVESYAWIQAGLGVVGSALPAVGFALLLSYMDLKNYWPYMVIGYVLFAYMGVSTIGLFLVGIAAAGLYMMNERKKLQEGGDLNG